MSNYAVTGDALTAIADAIRLKRDITDEISVADMPMQIGLIDGGGGGGSTIVTGTYTRTAESYSNTTGS